MKPLYVTSWLVLALAAAPRVAAADPDPKDAKDTRAADAAGRAHFQRGQRLTTQGDHAGAYREFEAGYAATGRPLFLFNMAESARAMGDADKARDNYQAFLQLDPTSALAATAKARLADLPPPAGKPAPGDAGAVPLLPPSATPPVSGTATPSSAGQPLPPLVAQDRGGHDPIWHKWPFWAVVAGTAVAAGVVVYAVERKTGNTNDPACGAGCTTIDLR
jgi:tetratricopeptide (TPR) repeat protein